jgi:hypothetical protein
MTQATIPDTLRALLAARDRLAEINAQDLESGHGWNDTQAHRNYITCVRSAHFYADGNTIRADVQTPVGYIHGPSILGQLLDAFDLDGAIDPEITTTTNRPYAHITWTTQ